MQEVYTCEECRNQTIEPLTPYGHQKHGLQYLCPYCVKTYEAERQTMKFNLKEGFAVCTDSPIVFVDEDGLEYAHISERSHYLYGSTEEAEAVLETNTERKSVYLAERLKVRKVQIDITLTPV